MTVMGITTKHQRRQGMKAHVSSILLGVQDMERSMSSTPRRIELTCAFMPCLLWGLVVMHMTVTLGAGR